MKVLERFKNSPIYESTHQIAKDLKIPSIYWIEEEDLLEKPKEMKRISKHQLPIGKYLASVCREDTARVFCYSRASKDHFLIKIISANEVVIDYTCKNAGIGDDGLTNWATHFVVRSTDPNARNIREESIVNLIAGVLCEINKINELLENNLVDIERTV